MNDFIDMPEQRPQEVKAPLDAIQAFADKIVVKRVQGEAVTKGGIIVPDVVQANNKPQEGVVLSVGHGTPVHGSFDFKPLSVKPGDRILFANQPSLINEVVCSDGSVVLILTEHLVIARIDAAVDDPKVRLMALVVDMHPLLARDMLEQLISIDVTQYASPVDVTTEELSPFAGLVEDGGGDAEVLQAAAALLPETAED